MRVRLQSVEEIVGVGSTATTEMYLFSMGYCSVYLCDEAITTIERTIEWMMGGHKCHK